MHTMGYDQICNLGEYLCLILKVSLKEVAVDNNDSYVVLYTFVMRKKKRPIKTSLIPYISLVQLMFKCVTLENACV